MMKKKWIALLLAAMMLLAMAAACGSDNNTVTPADPDSSNDSNVVTPDDSGSETTNKKIYYTYMSQDVDTLNGMGTVLEANDTPLSYCHSYLWRAVPSDDGLSFHYVPDLAEDMPKQIDEVTWEFTIREDAVWHDGTAITADDFIWTWQKVLDPTMMNPMANFLADNDITILNAYDYMLQGTDGYPESVDWEDVGIKQIDERTIQLTLAQEVNEKAVCTHFTNRATQIVKKDVYEANTTEGSSSTLYGTELSRWMGSGPYFFESWTRDSAQVYVKNENHWLADYFNYDEVHVLIVPEMNARVQLFEKGQLDSLSPDAQTIETYIDDPRMVSYPSTLVEDFDINVQNPDNPLCGSLNYRRALYYAVDRETIARDICGYMEPTGTYINGQAGSLSESGLTYRDSKYGQEVTQMIADNSAEGHTTGYNPELALEYMKKAYDECGLSYDTVVTIKVLNTGGDTEGARCCELFMESWPEIFDGMIQVEPYTVASGLSLTIMETEPSNWDIVLMDWGRSLSRTLPYQVYYYHTKDYTGRPTFTYTDRFEEQFAKCVEANTADYDTLLQETQKLELIALEDVISIPVVQCVNYELFADRLVLPMKQYVPGFGWGKMFGDIVE